MWPCQTGSYATIRAPGTRYLRIIGAMTLVITPAACGRAETATSCPARPVLHHPPVEYFEAGQIGYGPKGLDKPSYFDRIRFDYAKVLWAMGEPSLLQQAKHQSGETYRLSFSPAPAGSGGVAAIRVEATPTGARMTSARLMGTPASEFERPESAPNTPEGAIPVKCATKNVSSPEWGAIKECIERYAFWTVSTGEPSMETVDRFARVLEGMKNGQHHFILRESHERGAEERGMRLFTDCGRMLLRHASL
jgi:hypothetical protein